MSAATQRGKAGFTKQRCETVIGKPHRFYFGNGLSVFATQRKP